MIALQILGIVLATVLDFGPIGRQMSPFFSLTCGLVLIWAVTWFGQQRAAFQTAVLLGVAYGLVSFLSPVVWFVVFLGAYLIIEWLKGRFFEASSIILALLTLLIVSIWGTIVVGIATNSFDLLSLAGGAFANAVAGTLLYYFVGTRFKFLQRWAGRRL